MWSRGYRYRAQAARGLRFGNRVRRSRDAEHRYFLDMGLRVRESARP